MKWLKRLILIFLVLCVAIVIVALVAINPFGASPLNDYKTDGRLSLDGLTAEVRVNRDANGMAYIHAQNMDDLFMAQGFVTAQDRLFQMELTKRFAAGRIGELAGPLAKGSDVRMRTLGFRRQAQKHLAILDADTRQLLQKYVEGINAFIQERPDEIPLEFKMAGIAPEIWQPEDPVSILYFMGWNSAANIQNEIVGQMLVEKLGPEKAQEIFPLNINPAEAGGTDAALWPRRGATALLGAQALEQLLPCLPSGPLRVGSNNWVVSSGKTKEGKPILANDPHLIANTLPGPWYPCAMILPQNRVVGATIPGTPGIVIGRTRHLSFGITNSYGDVQDLYIETIDPHQPDHYLEGDRSIAFETLQETFKFKDPSQPEGYRSETIDIRATRRGPVLTGALPTLGKDRVVTIRWSAYESMTPRLGFDDILRCTNADEFRHMLRSVSQIALNYVFADADGNIGWQTTGRLPVRTQGDGRLPHVVTGGEDNWIGWIPFEQMPQDANPANEWLGTTNNKTITEAYPFYYSNYFACDYRQQRLMQLMAQANGTTAEDHWQYQRDIVNVKAQQIAPIMAAALLQHPDTAEFGSILRNWDGADSVDQAAPTLFHSIFETFARLVYADELGDKLAGAMLQNNYFWEQRLARMITDGHSPWFDNIQTPDVTETLDTLMHQAALESAEHLKQSLGDDPSQWLWGKIHQYEFISPIARSGRLKRWLGGGSYPANGSGDTLRRSRSPYGNIATVSVMASLRMVADMADPDKILAVLPGGVTGRQFDPHMTDQIAPFLDGQPLYWWFSDAAIEAHAKHTLVLSPKS